MTHKYLISILLASGISFIEANYRTVNSIDEDVVVTTKFVDKKIIQLFLMRKDIDLMIKNNEGMTVLDLAADMPAVREMLDEYIDDRSTKPKSPKDR